MKPINIELAVIGAGPAGLAAAVRAKEEGIRDLVVFERDERPGGILHQCIHTGFGLIKFNKDLTGPEYAHIFISELEKLKIPVELNSMVMEIDKDKVITVVNEAKGIKKYSPKTVIFAMGCRERTRGAVRIPGTRPAGIYTAGKAQRLVNIEGYLPGKEIVIVGSGDIGMIMARRLTLEGLKVKSVIEINSFAGGLIRNEVQCLHDFNIPLLLNHTVSEIHGYKRVEGVTVTEVDNHGNNIKGTVRFIDCDTILLSVGLIPENELTKMADILIDDSTNGPVVNNFLETELEGIFSCGNVLHVSDLVDMVSLEGEIAAEGAAARIKGRLPHWNNELVIARGENVGQIIPQRLNVKRDIEMVMRVIKPTGPMRININNAFSKKVQFSRPSEMIEMEIKKEKLKKLWDNSKNKIVKVTCREE